MAMTPKHAAAVERRSARGSWPVKAFRLGEEPGDDLSERTTPEERIAMMWRLAIDAWTSIGRPAPAGVHERPDAGACCPRAAPSEFDRSEMLNPDFLNLLAALVRAEARFLVVGAHAMAATRSVHRVGTLDVPFLGRTALLDNKRATGRTKELPDVEILERTERR
jgi:hypothetical protein